LLSDTTKTQAKGEMFFLVGGTYAEQSVAGRPFFGRMISAPTLILQVFTD